MKEELPKIIAKNACTSQQLALLTESKNYKIGSQMSPGVQTSYVSKVYSRSQISSKSLIYDTQQNDA